MMRSINVLFSGKYCMKKSGGRKSKGATISKQNSPREDNGGVGDDQRQETSEDVLERNLANVGNIQDLGAQEAKADEEADAELDEDISPEYEMFMRGKTEESMQQMKYCDLSTLMLNY
jgi:hypothetical protein